MIDDQGDQPNREVREESPEEPTKATAKRKWKQEVRPWNIEIRSDYSRIPEANIDRWLENQTWTRSENPWVVRYPS